MLTTTAWKVAAATVALGTPFVLVFCSETLARLIAFLGLSVVGIAHGFFWQRLARIEPVTGNSATDYVKSWTEANLYLSVSTIVAFWAFVTVFLVRRGPKAGPRPAAEPGAGTRRLDKLLRGEYTQCISMQEARCKPRFRNGATV